METLDIDAGDRIIVRVLKYDGTEHRCWNALVKRRSGPLIVLDAEFEFDVRHELLGNIQRGTRTIEYYWLDRWHNVFQFLDHAGGTRVFYCNINTPPRFADGVLSYTDLDIDLLVQPDLSYQVLDLDEFEANAKRYGYSDQVRRQAASAVEELVTMIERCEFPFTEPAWPSSVTSVVS